MKLRILKGVPIIPASKKRVSLFSHQLILALRTGEMQVGDMVEAPNDCGEVRSKIHRNNYPERILVRFNPDTDFYNVWRIK